MPILAIHENGVLRPLQPLDIAEHQTVAIEVVSVIQEASSPVDGTVESVWRKYARKRFGAPADDFDALPPGFEDLAP